MFQKELNSCIVKPAGATRTVNDSELDNTLVSGAYGRVFLSANVCAFLDFT